jgi:hypothetical protein
MANVLRRLCKLEARITERSAAVPHSKALYQVAIAAKSTNSAFLESCVCAYMGGAKTPLLLSSGMEDYFLGTYYFNRGKYYTPGALAAACINQ